MKKFPVIRSMIVSLVILAFSAGCGSSSVLSSGSTLLKTLGSNPNLSTVTSLLQTPGLSKLLGGALKGPSTLLAPTNDAFNALGPGAVDNLKNPANVQQVADLLKNSIVPGKLDASALQKGGVTTAAGNPLNLGDANLGNVISADNVNIIPIDKILK